MLGTSLKPLTAPAFMIARQIMPCRYGHWVGLGSCLGMGAYEGKMLDSQPHQTIGYCKTSRHSPQTHTSSKWLTANTVFGSNPLNARITHWFSSLKQKSCGASKVLRSLYHNEYSGKDLRSERISCGISGIVMARSMNADGKRSIQPYQGRWRTTSSNFCGPLVFQQALGIIMEPVGLLEEWFTPTECESQEGPLTVL